MDIIPSTKTPHGNKSRSVYANTHTWLSLAWAVEVLKCLLRWNIWFRDFAVTRSRVGSLQATPWTTLGSPGSWARNFLSRVNSSISRKTKNGDLRWSYTTLFARFSFSHFYQRTPFKVQDRKAIERSYTTFKLHWRRNHLKSTKAHRKEFLFLRALRSTRSARKSTIRSRLSLEVKKVNWKDQGQTSSKCLNWPNNNFQNPNPKV
jgi:hypothetical protein